MTRRNPLRSALLVIAGALALYLALGMLGRVLVAVAHAAPPAPMSTLQPVPGPVEVVPVVSTPSTPASPGMPWQAWLAIGIAALGGLETMLRGARAVLTAIAPRTKTTADDNVRDFVAKLDDNAIAILRALLGMVPPPETVSSVAPTAPGRASITGIGTVPLLIAFLLAGAASQACTHDQRTAAKHALWDCTSPARSDLVTATTPLAVSAIKLATNPDGSIDTAKLKAYLKPANLLSEAGVIVACAAVAAFEIVRSAASDRALIASTGPAQATPDALAAAELELRAPWGDATFRLADGVQ